MHVVRATILVQQILMLRLFNKEEVTEAEFEREGR
jgi:hypothetical protein